MFLSTTNFYLFLNFLIFIHFYIFTTIYKGVPDTVMKLCQALANGNKFPLPGETKFPQWSERSSGVAVNHKITTQHLKIHLNEETRLKHIIRNLGLTHLIFRINESVEITLLYKIYRYRVWIKSLNDKKADNFCLMCKITL